ncbi:hypothetical protein ACFYL6_19060 [Micromonospora sp. NPDC007208]|uniref:hypothetical protein n=1 Tax=Micromonospora sp. NPDC007208 TaxID=3364236 RepID=UPI0036943F75
MSDLNPRMFRTCHTLRGTSFLLHRIGRSAVQVRAGDNGGASDRRRAMLGGDQARCGVGLPWSGPTRADGDGEQKGT